MKILEIILIENRNTTHKRIRFSEKSLHLDFFSAPLDYYNITSKIFRALIRPTINIFK